MRKEFVNVIVFYQKDGRVLPRAIQFRDEWYEIDKVLDRKPGVSLKVGGVGMRYTIQIGGQVTYLFEEDGRWFVEAKDGKY